MGLILVTLVEKFAEHLTANDEAFDNTMNLVLSHSLVLPSKSHLRPVGCDCWLGIR